MNKELVKRIIKFLMIAVIGISSIGIANANNVPEGFQYLRYIAIFNGTDLLPDDIVENALIPEGFFDPLEKNVNISKIKEINNQKKMVYNHAGHLREGLEEREIKNKFLGNLSAVDTSSSQDITFTGKVYFLWNYSIKDGVMYSQVVQDLDGDRLNDTLTTIYRYNLDTDTYYYTFIAKKGANGATIWQDTISGKNTWVYAYTIGDLNGDKLNDIMISIENYDTINDKYNIKLNAKRGKDGTDLWQQNVISGDRVWAYTHSVDDLSGDGLKDIIVRMEDYSSSYYSYILKVKKGIDGTDLYQESITRGWLAEYPVGDLDDDGRNDLLILARNYSADTSVLKAKRGKYFTNLWQESVNKGYIDVDIGDLDGDNLNDALVRIWNYSSYNVILKAKRGLDGTDLWQESIYGYNMDGKIVKDLDDDAKNDVLVTKHNSVAPYATIEARKGKYGTVIWQESSDNINTYYYINYPADAGDLNGDGLNDVLMLIYKYDSYTRTYTLKAKKGIDGTDLWQESMSSDNNCCYAWIYGYPVEDLNGDKLNDMLIKKDLRNYNTDTDTEILKAKKGIDGADLWQESISGTRWQWIDGISAGDLNGDKLNDVLVHIYNSPYSTIKAKKGIDGTDLWKKSKTAYMYGYLTDLNGDKLNDVLINIGTRGYGALLATIGKNGIDMWRAEAYDYLWWNIPDDVNGNGNKDILLGSHFDGKMHLVTGVRDIVPPSSITNLKNITYKRTYINWTWKDPSNLDLSKVMVYLNGNFKTNVTRGRQFYNATGLNNNAWYKISTHTVDYSGNINKTWVNRTAKTSP